MRRSRASASVTGSTAARPSSPAASSSASRSRARSPDGPRLVWADEPTGNLDSEMAASVMELLAELHAEGLTLILVTHDPNVAARRRPADHGQGRRDRRRRAARLALRRWRPGRAGRAMTASLLLVRPRLAAVPLRPRPQAGAAAPRPPQRRPPAARGGARRARVAARRRDHHRLGDRRRHDERVDPAGRPARTSARSTSSCPRAAPGDQQLLLARLPAARPETTSTASSGSRRSKLPPPRPARACSPRRAPR